MPSTHFKRQCKAKTRSGRRCTQAPIRGGVVCRMHGGGAPQVKRAARLRLAALVDPAIATLASLLRHQTRRRHPQTALSAANSVLDRTGYPKTDQFQLGGPLTLIDPEQAAGMTDAELAMTRALLEKWIGAQPGS